MHADQHRERPRALRQVKVARKRNAVMRRIGHARPCFEFASAFRPNSCLRSSPLNAVLRAAILKQRLRSCNGKGAGNKNGLSVCPRAPAAVTSIAVNGTTIEAVERGQGRPILFLHPGIGIDAGAPVLDALAHGGRVIAPSHPGFGTSQLPKGMSTVDDLSYFYLDLLEQLDLRRRAGRRRRPRRLDRGRDRGEGLSRGCRGSSWPTPSASRSATARPATSSTSGR